MEKKPYPSETQERFIVRLPDGMRDQIAEAAKAANRSMNAEVVVRLEQSFKGAPQERNAHVEAWARERGLPYDVALEQAILRGVSEGAEVIIAMNVAPGSPLTMVRNAISNLRDVPDDAHLMLYTSNATVKIEDAAETQSAHLSRMLQSAEDEKPPVEPSPTRPRFRKP